MSSSTPGNGFQDWKISDLTDPTLWKPNQDVSFLFSKVAALWGPGSPQLQSSPTLATAYASAQTLSSVKATEFLTKAVADQLYSKTGSTTTTSGGGGSGTVTHTGGALVADAPVFGAGGADIKVGTKRGNTDQVQMAAGAATTGHVLIYDANGNAVDGGTVPGGGVTSISGAAPIAVTSGFTPVVSVSLATTSATGVVKPDGTTIIIDGSGVISSTGGGVASITGTSPITVTPGPTPVVSVALATTSAAGTVKPDGTTITVAVDGTITAGGLSGIPTTIPGLSLWISADQISGLSDGSQVTIWPSNIASKPPFVIFPGTAGPVYKVNIQNSLPVVRFTVTNGGYFRGVSPEIISLGQSSIFIVVQFSSFTPTYSGVFASTQGGYGYYIKSNGKSALYTTGGNYDGSGAKTLAASTFYVLTVIDGVVGATTYVGTDQDYTSSDGGLQSVSLYSIGTLGGDPQGGANRVLGGDIAEVVGYAGVLSAAQISTVQNYLKTKWAC